ncbi:MAG: hypothetical protein IPP96_12890 [Chitinophagaceae bacterium]|nr:hypothetical protein [Chitinophagaceae bacterium]
MKNRSRPGKLFLKLNLTLPVIFICIAQVLFSYDAFSQDSTSYAGAKERLVKTLKKRYIDKSFTQTIDHFYNITCDSLIKKDFIIEDKPIKNILTNLFLACEDKINTRSITSLRIPSLNYNFLLILHTYKKQPIRNLFREIGITQTAILQSSFDGLLLGDSIRTIVGLREMLNNPYFISTRINLPRYSPFKDTLLYFLANGAPDILLKKLADADPVFTGLVTKSNNMTVKAVCGVKKDNYYDKIMPFSLAIFENRISIEKIRELALSPQGYYEAFIDEALRLYKNPDPETKAFLQQPIIDINKNLANIYFIREINMLHESPDKTRFQVLNTLIARDLYFLLIGGSGQLYTSSFMYVYKKFLKETEKEGLDKFFEDIDYYQFNNLMSNISGYGLVDDLVNHLKEEKVAGLIGKYLSGLTNRRLTDNEIILNAMTLAEVLYEIGHHEIIKNTLLKQIDTILKQPRLQYLFMYRRMCIGFKDILLNKTDYKTDDTYDVLAIKRLQKNNTIVQACFFYDDEDAASSFGNSTAVFNNATWNKTDRGNFIVFNSRSGNEMKVYMNKPNTGIGFDSAQNEMLLAIRQEGLEVTSFIHRGHSYYLLQSLNKMTPSGQFIFLGSCGGYNEVLKVFQLNPDVNVIVTRNIGSKLINDPLLDKINMEMVNNKDIEWNILWQELNASFQSKLTKDLFSSYIPPNKYIGIKFIREIFNF